MKMRQISSQHIPEKITWRGRQYDVPTDQEITQMVFDDICTTPEGDEVEPDHRDSWLRILKIL